MYSKGDFGRALFLCSIVGTWLVALYQGAAILSGNWSLTLYLQVFLDYATPFTVSSITGLLRNRSDIAKTSEDAKK